MVVFIAIVAQAATEADQSEAKDLYPHASELIVGAIAFAVLFGFMLKFVMPKLNQALDERRHKIQGELEHAEATRVQADEQLAEYRRQLAGASDEANRVIEESRRTADQLRRDIQAKAEEESRATVARAQDEIRAERDRVFQELRVQVGEIAVDLAGRVVGRSLDQGAHEKLIDDYIDEVAKAGKNGSAE